MPGPGALATTLASSIFLGAGILRPHRQTRVVRDAGCVSSILYPSNRSNPQHGLNNRLVDPNAAQRTKRQGGDRGGSMGDRASPSSLAHDDSCGADPAESHVRVMTVCLTYRAHPAFQVASINKPPKSQLGRREAIPSRTHKYTRATLSAAPYLSCSPLLSTGRTLGLTFTAGMVHGSAL